MISTVLAAARALTLQRDVDTLLIAGTGTSTPAEGRIEGPVDEAVVRDIAAGVLAR